MEPKDRTAALAAALARYNDTVRCVGPSPGTDEDRPPTTGARTKGAGADEPRGWRAPGFPRPAHG